jgi:hypothetical protein
MTIFKSTKTGRSLSPGIANYQLLLSSVVANIGKESPAATDAAIAVNIVFT